MAQPVGRGMSGDFGDTPDAPPNVRFGPKADITSALTNVRFWG